MSAKDRSKWRFPVQQVLLLTQEDGDRIKAIKEASPPDVPRADILREIVAAGLPVVERRVARARVRSEPHSAG